MSSPSNLSSVSIAQNNSTSPGQFYSNYFISRSTVTIDQNDAVVAYFQEVTDGNLQGAQILASTVIYTAIAMGMDPMSIIQEFQAVPEGQLSLYVAMFLNLNRIGTSIVGVNNQQNTNQSKYITRSIIA